MHFSVKAACAAVVASGLLGGVDAKCSGSTVGFGHSSAPNPHEFAGCATYSVAKSRWSLTSANKDNYRLLHGDFNSSPASYQDQSGVWEDNGDWNILCYTTPCEEATLTFTTVECGDCPVGSKKQDCITSSFSAMADRQCTECGGGAISDGTQNSCARCPAGQEANDAGNACVSCPDGRYRSASSNDGCTWCPFPKGATSDHAGCESCEPGEATQGTGACTPCDGNQISSSGVCGWCPSGTYQSRRDSRGRPIAGWSLADCLNCERGTFAETGSTSCDVCPARTFTDMNGQSSCKACPYTNILSTDKTSCAPCAAGQVGLGTECADVLSADLAQCNPEVATIIVEAIVDKAVVVNASTAPALVVCAREWLSDRLASDDTAAAAAAAAAADIVAAAHAADPSAAQLQLLTALRLVPVDGNRVDNSFYSWHMPPPPSLADDGTTYDLASYEAIFGSRAALHTRCVDLIASAVDCPCFQQRTLGSSTCFDIAQSDFGLTMTTMAFCGVHESVVGEDLSATLFTRAYQCTAARAERSSWSLESQPQLLQTLQTLRDLAAAAGKADTALAQLAFDALGPIAWLGGDVERLAAFGADESMTLPEVWDARQLTIARLESDLAITDVGLELKNALVQVGGLVRQSYESLQSRIAQAETNTNAAITSLGQLVSTSSQTLSDQTRAAFVETMGSLVTEATVQRNTAKTLVEDTDNQLEQKDNELTSVVKRIQEELGFFEAIIDALKAAGLELAEKSEEFIGCVESEQLAALARARLTAIFDVVEGSITAVAEVGAFVASGSASAGFKSALKSSTKGLTKARSFVGNFKSSSRAAYKDVKTRIIDNAADVPQAVLDNKGAVLSAIEQGRDLIEFFQEVDLGSAEGWLTITQSGLALAGELGVPGAEGAAQILGGVSTLIDYEDSVDAIEDEAEAKLDNARQAFKDLGALVEEVAKFAATLILEFYDVAFASEPPSGASAAESVSPARWGVMGRNIIGFVQSTETYNDMVARVGGRRVLSHDEEEDSTVALAAGEQQRRLALRAAVTSPALSDSEEKTPQMRRALSGKGPEGCTEADAIAEESLGIYGSYFATVSDGMIFGEAMHASMVKLVQVARDIKVLRLQRVLRKQNVDDWNAAIDELSDVSADLTNAELDARYATFLKSLPAVERNFPELQWTAPDAAAALEVATAFSPLGIFREACSFLFYTELSFAPQGADAVPGVGCDLDFDAALEAAAPFYELSAKFITPVKDQLEVPRWTTLITRLPVADLDGLRLMLTETGSATVVPYGAKVSLDLRYPDSDLVSEITACGHNAEILDIVPILERDHVPLRPNWVSGDWSRTSFVDQTGPFLKVAEDGRRVVFAVDEAADIAQGTVVVRESPCTGNFDQFRFKDGAGTDLTFYGCIKQVDEEELSRDALPVLSLFSWKLTDEFVDEINSAHSDLDLVFYARVRVRTAVNSCALQRSPLRAEEPLDADVTTVNPTVAGSVPVAAIAVGAGSVALVAAVAAIVARHKARAGRQASDSGTQDPPRALVAANPKFAARVDVEH